MFRDISKLVLRGVHPNDVWRVVGNLLDAELLHLAQNPASYVIDRVVLIDDAKGPEGPRGPATSFPMLGRASPGFLESAASWASRSNVSYSSTLTAAALSIGS